MADSKKYDGSQWEHSLRKLTTATADIEPTIYTDGTAITAYTIKGNTVQSGTPTPSNPVDVQGVGERTENLFPLNASKLYAGRIESDGTIDYIIGTITVSGDSVAYQSSEAWRGFYTDYIPATDRQNLTITPNTSGNVAWTWGCSCYDTSGNFLGKATAVYSDSAKIFTLVQGTTKVRLNVTSANTTYTITKPMLNYGSSSRPHEPYGYKIPISSGGVTTNLYLGSVQSTRPIRKLVFTGNENFTKVSGQNYIYIYSLTYLYKAKSSDLLCTHLPRTAGLPVNGGFCISSDMSTSYMNFGAAVMDIQPSGDTVEGLKEYLASQYANGTPVTVYYPLQDNLVPTATVNEPLMKIGDYTDTLSNAASIPTTEGANSITVDTTVQPSEFTATWTGWHDASVKEYDGTNWQ